MGWKDGERVFDAETLVRAALAAWDEARAHEAAGRPIKAISAYRRGLTRFLGYRRSSHSSDTAAVYYAFGAMAREMTHQLDRAGAGRKALEYGRMALVASHLGDPAAGDPRRVRDVLDASRAAPVHQLVVGRERGPLLAPALRVAGGAEARSLLSELLRKYPEVKARKRAGWPVGPGPWQRGFHAVEPYLQAVSPSCAGLDENAEMRQLAVESARLYRALCRCAPEYAADARRAENTLARVQSGNL
ncbi:hypothetical protein [Streptomyces sp. NBC_00859]|uniref:hypothetical protein n=1 Tax=Streptomyces sp. NBC_00859 TaxID=2903682 RepID=UPI00386D962A|nr:hypothetical protein OG584_18585 [Streptomyces sp. NBC_00859]